MTAGRPSRTIVVGLGNPVLGDDGVGWHVADALARRLAMLAPRVELDRLAVGGLALMERLEGFDRAILIDALVGAGIGTGTVATGPLEALPPKLASHLDSSHDASLLAALEAGRALGATIPSEVLVVGVGVAPVDRFDERLSPPVAGAVPAAVAAVLQGLGETGRGTTTGEPGRRMGETGRDA